MAMQSDESIFKNVKPTQLPDFRNWVLDFFTTGVPEYRFLLKIVLIDV